MTKAVWRADAVKVLGVARRNRPALMTSTALQAAAIVVVSLPAFAQLSPNARPTGGTVVGGQATIGNTATTTTIAQTTQKTAIDWQSFNVGSQQTVLFVQPNASAIALNRVVGPDPSQIAGRITANGQIIVQNQSGVMFLDGAQVNTSGLMVTAVGISNSNFMAGNMVFDQAATPGAKVTNAGTLTVKGAGLAALVAPSVANSGTIDAKMGNVVLAGAQAVTLDMYGDGLVSVNVTKQVTQAPDGTNALVTNTGVIRAAGGTVRLTAAAADGVVTNLVTAGGTITANTVGNKTGTISIAGVGGNIEITGQLGAEGLATGTTGGTVAMTATGNVALRNTAVVSTSGKAGGGTVAIGTTLNRTQTATNVSIAAGATVKADATDTGKGGSVTILSTAATSMAGSITAKGGPNGGDGGFVEVSGNTGFSLTGMVDVSAPSGKQGSILIDPRDLDIVAVGSGDANVTAIGVDVTAPDQNTTISVSASALTALTGSLTIEASQNLTVSAPLLFTNQVAGNSVTMFAGKDLTVNAAISTAGGDLTLKAAVSTDGVTAFKHNSPAGSLTISAALGSASTGNIVLAGGTGGVALAASVTTASGKTVTIGSTDTINQTSGSIVTTGLALTAANAIALTGPNAVGTVAASIIGSKQAFSLNNTATSLTVGIVGAVTGIATNNGAVSLTTTTSGDINLGQAIGAGTGTVALTSAGSIGQSGGSIVAKNLAVMALNAVALTGANKVGTVAASVTGASQGFSLNNTLTSLTVDTVGVVTGIATNNGNVVLSTTTSGGMALNQNIGAGTGNVTLTAAGGINQTGGSITAATLTGSSSGGAATSLTNANLVTNLGAFSSNGPSFAFTNNQALTTTGVLNAAGNLALTTTTGGLTLGANVSASGSTVTLISAGTIGQSAGSIVASTLSLTSAGGATLTGTANAIGSLGSIQIGGAGDFALVNTGSVGVAGPVTGATNVSINSDTIGVTGSIAAGTALRLVAGTGGITLGAGHILSAPTIDLSTTGGGIAQTGTGTVSAGSILQSGSGVTGTVALLGITNAIGNLGNFTVTSGDFLLATTSQLSVNGSLSASGNILLQDTNVASQITVGAGGQINAGAAKLASVQADTFSITTLGTVTGGTFELAPNTPSTPFVLGAGGNLVDYTGIGSASVRIGAVTVGGTLQTATASTIIIASNFGSSAVALDLRASGDITQLAATTLTASTLSGAASSVTLGNTIHAVSTLANAIIAVGTLGSFKSTNDFTLVDGQALTVAGTVTAGPITASPTLANTKTLTLSTNAGAIVLGSAVLDAGTVLLNSSGTIGQTTGTIIANVLTASAVGDLILKSAANNVTVFGGLSAAGGDVVLVTNPPTVLTGIFAGTNLFFEVAVNGGTLQLGSIAAGATLQATAASNPRITFVSDNVTESGIANSMTATGGSVEVATFSSANVSVGAIGSSNFDTGLFSLISASGAKTLKVGTFTDAPNGGTVATMTGSLSVATVIAAPTIVLSAGTIGISGFVNAGTLLSLGATGGGITESGSINAGTLTSVGTIAGGATLTGTNTIGALGSIVLSSGTLALKTTGSLNVAGNVGAPNISLTAGTIGIAGFLNAPSTVALGATLAAIGESGSITAGTLVSIGTIASSATLNGTNTIAVLGNFNAATGFALTDTGSLSVAGTVSAANIQLNADTIGIAGFLNAGTTTTLGAAAGGITESGNINAGTLVSNGIVVGGATLTGTNTIATLGNFAVSGGDFSLTSTGSLSVAGQISGPNVAVNAGTLSIAIGGFLNATTTVALGASAGGITESGSITASTLVSVGTINGGATLTGTNTIAVLGTANVTSGDFTLTNSGSLNVAGAVAARNISLNATAIGFGSGGFLNAGTTVALGASAGGVTESGVGSIAAGTLIGNPSPIVGGVTLNGTNTIATIGSLAYAGALVLNDTTAPTISGVVDSGTGSGALSAMFAVPSLTIGSGGILNAGSVTITTSAGGVTETGTGRLITSSLSIATTGAFDVSLKNVNNQIGASNGIQVGNGNLILVDGSSLTLTGPFTANNLFFQITPAGSTIALGTLGTPATLTAGGRISIVADNLTENASTKIAATGGTVEIAPFSTTVAMNLGGATQLAVDSTLLGNIGTGTLTIGGYTDATNGNAAKLTAANITLAAAVDLTGKAATLNLLTLGSIAGGSNALTVGTLSGTAASSVNFSSAANNIQTLGSFGVGSGSFTLVDNGNTGNLTVAGPVTASSVTIGDANTGTISVTGTINATTLLSLAAGSGGLKFNAGTILTASTVDLSAAGGGLTQGAGDGISATILRSTSGVTGTVTLGNAVNNVATLGQFAVASGDFTLVNDGNTGNLSVTGPVTAANVKISDANTGTISVGGSIGATTSLVLASGNGGIQLNSGAILNAPTVDLSATGGGVTESGTGSIIASTVLQSTNGVTGTVSLSNTANNVASVGPFAVTGGNFALVDNGNTGALAVTGPVTAANVSIADANTGTIVVTGSIGATTSLVLASGAGGIQLNTGEILSGATVDLSPISGGVTQVPTGMIVASSVLRSTSGVTGTVNLAGTANTIASVGSFAVTSGDFSLVDTGNLSVAGKLTAPNITLNSPTITVTGSVGATTALTLASGAGGIQLNTGEILSGATVDLSATGGGVTQVAIGTIIASSMLQSTAGVTGTVALAGTANTIASVGSFAVTSGDFSLVNTGNLGVAGKLTAGNIALNSPTITVTGSVGATTALTLASGAGGVLLNTGEILSGATVDLSATGSGVTQVSTGMIVANSVLQSASGVTGTVNLAGTGNTIASVGSFAVTSGNFSLVDTGNLGVAGKLTASNIVMNSPTITVTGSVGATTALTLAAGAGGIQLNTGEILSGATVDLSATGGGVTQVSTGTIAASSVLRSTSGVTGTVVLAGTANNVPSLGSFAVTIGNFTLLDSGNTGNLSVTGPVTAGNVTIAGAGTLTATGSIGATTGVTLASGNGGIQLNSGAILNAPTVDLSATGGGVTESGTGSIIASTVLQSTNGVTGTVSLSNTANNVASVGPFAVTGGNFALVDNGNTGALAVTGPVTAANVSIADANTGTIVVTGSIGATTSLVLASGSGGIKLSAAEILSSATADLSTTGGGVTQVAGGIVNATVLTSSNGIGGAVSLPSTLNQIGTIGGMTVTGNLAVTDSQALTLAGKIAGSTVDLTTTVGGVTQAPGGTLLAAIFTSSGGIAGALTLKSGANQIGTISAVTATGAIAVLDSTALSLNGVVSAGAGSVDLSTASGGVTQVGGALIAGTLTSGSNIAGTVTLMSSTNQIGTIAAFASGGLKLNDSIGVTLAGMVSVGNAGAMDISSTGGISQTASGVLIAGALTSSGGLGASSTLAGTGNQIGSVSNIAVASGTLSLTDSIALAISGKLSAHQITVTDPGHTVSLANGTTIVTDGIVRPFGVILAADLPTATKNTNGGAYFTADSFKQSGELNAGNLSGPANILRIDATGTIAFDTTTGLNGPNTWLILGLTGTAFATGAINVKALDINFTGAGGGASLSGSVAGLTGQAASAAANIVPATDGKFKVNACAIHSVNCVLLPSQGVPQLAPNSEIVFAIPFIQNIEDNQDIVVPLVSDSNDSITFDFETDQTDRKYRIRRHLPTGIIPILDPAYDRR